MIILSNAYCYIKKYAVVYSTGNTTDLNDGLPAVEEVEFVAEKFFKSEKKAWKWFNKKFIPASFVNPRVVEVVGFQNLKIAEKE
jgi:hypothetical protein